MSDKIVRNYKLTVNGVLSIEDGHAYISIVNGPQDLDLVKLIEDFDGKNVQLICSWDDEYCPNDIFKNY